MCRKSKTRFTFSIGGRECEPVIIPYSVRSEGCDRQGQRQRRMFTHGEKWPHDVKPKCISPWTLHTSSDTEARVCFHMFAFICLHFHLSVNVGILQYIFF